VGVKKRREKRTADISLDRREPLLSVAQRETLLWEETAKVKKKGKNRQKR